jgi:antitoxin (DNA-binding transcriptional repressor) of toxin-antitoxin stability system
MIEEISVSEARANLPQILDRVIDGGEVTITRHGKPVAVMIRPDLLRVRRASTSLQAASDLGRLLRSAGEMSLASGEGLSEEYAEALVAEVRAGRQDH